ncbi:Cell surface protein [Oopsacas minuta]|uniref:Cell surface protein n=1 Tax=Oopsacas minuta TaxID=111878 RepID=A0AAV7K9K8_9METZ|nr:Cell surface protein [Oopsacas minuta]
MATANPCENNKLLDEVKKLGKLVGSGIDYPNKKQPLVTVCDRGTGNEQLRYPLDVTVDNNTGNIYLADQYNHCIKLFDSTAKYLFKFGDNKGEGAMHFPECLSIYGNRIVISQSSNCIMNYQLDGKFISKVGKFGKGNLEFNYPRGITIDEFIGDVYICDASNNRIQILSENLHYKSQFGKDILTKPLDIKLNRDNIFILDESNPCLHIFNKDLVLQKNIISRGEEQQVISPFFFFLDNSDNILISDYGSDSIQIFNSKYECIHKISIPEPSGITLDDKDSNTIFEILWAPCQVLLENISVLLKVLDSIIYDGKYDSGIASDAFSLSKCIDFQFCLCLVTFTDILKLCNIISNYLQNEDLNISSASLHIEYLISTLQGYTTETYFDQLYLQAEKLAENIGVTYSEPRHRKVPTRLDDSEHHVPIVLTGKDRMKEQFFNDVIELIKEALQSRFSHETMPLLKSIECLNPPKAENIQDLRVLPSYYIGDFDADLIEYVYKLLAKSIELSNIGKIGIHKLYLYMVKEGIAKLYPNLNILYRLILALPVTSSACECSFSTLKLIKTRLRSTMCEDRLSNLLLLSVESNRMKSIPKTFEKIHERFWNTPRK